MRFCAATRLRPAAGGERQFVLGDLVALAGRVEIIFAGEAGWSDGAVQGQRGTMPFDGALVEDGESAGSRGRPGRRCVRRSPKRVDSRRRFWCGEELNWTSKP